MIPNRKQQLFHLTSLRQARIQARTPQSPSEKVSLIRLKSLKDARDEIKRTRPDSVIRMSESFSKIDQINEELRRRSVFSLSPTASSDQLELSPALSERITNDEYKEGSPAPVFIENFKPDLPEICENNIKEEGDEEKVTETKEEKAENVKKDEKIEVKKEEKKEIKVEKNRILPSNTTRNLKGVMRKPQSRVGRVEKGKNEVVLEFMEETKLKKKLTKSQERGLLDRLQGFSTKILSSNK